MEPFDKRFPVSEKILSSVTINTEHSSAIRQSYTKREVISKVVARAKCKTT